MNRKKWKKNKQEIKDKRQKLTNRKANRIEKT